MFAAGCRRQRLSGRGVGGRHLKFQGYHADSRCRSPWKIATTFTPYMISYFGALFLHDSRSGAGLGEGRQASRVVARSILEPIYSPPPNRMVECQDRWTRQVLVLGVWLPHLIALLRLRASSASNRASSVNRAPLHVVGGVLGYSGAIVRLLAMRNLGTSRSHYAEINNNHHLVTDGVYGVVRHPAYVGATLLYIGTGLQLGDRRSVVALSVLPLLARIPRMIREERLLASVYPGYATYRREVPALVPRLPLTNASGREL